MKFYDLTLGILATWRVTYFFQAEDGPWDVVVRLRRFVGNGFWGTLLDCFYCLSVWIAAPFACWLGETWGERFLLWLSFSGGASIIQKITNRHADVPPALFVEEPGQEKTDGHAAVRREANSSGGSLRSGRTIASRRRTCVQASRRFDCVRRRGVSIHRNDNAYCRRSAVATPVSLRRTRRGGGS